jgi:ribosomal protein L11 methyltransferase
MNWYEITIDLTEEATEAVADWLHHHGAGGVSIEESGTLTRQRDTSYGQWFDTPLNDIPPGMATMQAYFPEPSDVDTKLNQLEAFLANLPQYDIDPGQVKVSYRMVHEESWADAWKQYFKPMKIGERLVIKPTWEQYKPIKDEIVIELDPGMAFGTGTHATTALCMRALEHVLQHGDRVIDIGTGSGILAITAAHLGASQILALDLDPVAVSSARENISLNHLADRVIVKQSDLLDILRTEGQSDPFLLPADVIVANILADIIVHVMTDVHRSLRSGGIFIASGIITAKEAEVNHALQLAGFERVQREEQQDWVAVIARKINRL